jgi:SAM-dependent methyltransferase
MGEPELVSALAGDGAQVLDLGAGCGRIANRLVELGHAVVAVDNSPDMLALVRGADPHLGEIVGLDLGDRFDAVLLASHLINVPESATRLALLETAARHLRPGGRLIVQWHPPEWFDGLAVGRPYAGTVGPFLSRLSVRAVDGDLLTAAVTYVDGLDQWTQEFQARRLTLDDVAAMLHRTGFHPEGPVPGEPDWLTGIRSEPD